MKYDTLKKKFGEFASWAYWDPTDIEVLPDDKTPKNYQYVFVGLNASKANDHRIWGNYHKKHRGGSDWKLQEALMGTKYEGSYLTDIIKWPDEAKSSVIKKALKNNPKEIKKHLDMFLKELELLEDVKVIIVFGNDAYYYVEMLRSQIEKKGIQIRKITHYSAPKMRKHGAYKDYIKRELNC